MSQLSTDEGKEEQEEALETSSVPLGWWPRNGVDEEDLYGGDVGGWRGSKYMHDIKHMPT